MQKIKKRYLILLPVFMSLIFYMLWGPLFPWNPIKIGYKEIISSKATIFIGNITEKDSVVYQINEIIEGVEKFHDLTYVDDFIIIILDKESNNRRYLPWLNGSGFSVSLSPLNLIYIGSIARKSPSGIEPYLKHELSHLLIDQNTTFIKAMKIHKQAWFVEGIAEYFSGHSFYSKNELVKLMELNDVQMTGLKEKSPQNMSWQELQLKYSYYRYFIEFLVESHGMKKLQEYIKLYINDPEGYKKLFLIVYSFELDEFLKKYNSSLNK